MTLQHRMAQYSSLKALQILQALADNQAPMKLVEICEVTGLSQSTVFRIIQELTSCGFVMRSEKRKDYSAGINAWLLAGRFPRGGAITMVADEEMERINRISGETVHLIGLDGEEAVYLAKKEALCQIQLKSRPGWHIPLSCTAGGKVILAFKDKAWVDSFFSHNPLKKYTDKTITDLDEMMAELEKVRRSGYAIDDHEHNGDIVCIACPIFNETGEVLATIGISAPDYRFSVDKAVSLVEELKRSAERISALIGYVREENRQ